METLELIKTMIRTGERKKAFGQLGDMLRSDKNNKEAWWLMLALVDDDCQKQDCYQQILRIDPHDKIAKKHLEVLWKIDTGELRLETKERGKTFRCSNCGGDLEIHFIVKLKDKWATCPYCQAKIVTPDS
jgi:DNA-directed RNA polymerase subunit RPC12/RpoP